VAASEQFTKDQFTCMPLTAQCWQDFEQMFSEHGPQNGCWCMYWRIPRHECQHQFGEGNRLALKSIVDSGRVPGLLAYLGAQPVGWCSIAPREEFTVLDRSPTLKRIDDQPVWSIVCFFTAKNYRRRGMTGILIQAAVAYAAEHGARIVEAYPLRTEIAKMLPYERFMGLESIFSRAGFIEVARRSDRRPVMRFKIPVTP
jgi:GNAT superfamily N-acetyltransferase